MKLNQGKDTLIVVQSVGGYEQMCRNNRALWEHHGLPVVVLSPTDKPCIVEGMACAQVGRDQHAGPISIERWQRMLEWCLRQPYDYFFLTESDAVCLEPELPLWLWGIHSCDLRFWSNEMPDNAAPPRQQFYCIAPYFFHRSLAQRILNISQLVPCGEPQHGDRWIGLMLEAGSIPHQKFSPGIGCGTLDPVNRRDEFQQVLAVVRSQGAPFIHGIKTPEVRDALVRAYADWKADTSRNRSRRIFAPPRYFDRDKVVGK